MRVVYTFVFIPESLLFFFCVFADLFEFGKRLDEFTAFYNVCNEFFYRVLAGDEGKLFPSVNGVADS